MKRDDFAAFILTHGRPNDVSTYAILRKHGYSGRIILVIDNEDQHADEYRARYPHDDVVVFDKAAVGQTFDLADTQSDRRATVFARNASFEIARKLGLRYHIQLDDDYNCFRYRYINADGSLGSHDVRNLDAVFDAMIAFLDASGATSVALSQGGDFLGSATDSQALRNPLMRKCMNSWLFRTNNPITFIGRMNDDVNTYVVYGARGQLFFTISLVMLDAQPTQQTAGGMTDIYLNVGTYAKSMYTVMMAPSCTRVRRMGRTDMRLHHSIRWDHAVPKIISGKYQKQR
jgi:hypothetical protein